MSDLVPFILSKESLKKVLAEKYLSVILDGTTRLGEIALWHPTGAFTKG